MEFNYEIVERAYKEGKDARYRAIREKHDDPAEAEREIVLDEIVGESCLEELKEAFKRQGDYTVSSQTIDPRTTEGLGAILMTMQCAEEDAPLMK